MLNPPNRRVRTLTHGGVGGEEPRGSPLSRFQERARRGHSPSLNASLALGHEPAQSQHPYRGAVLETIMPRIFNKSFAKICLLYVCLGVAALQFSGCSSREQRAQNYYDQGKSYLAKKDYVKARLELRNALQLKTDMIEAWRALAEVDEH